MTEYNTPLVPPAPAEILPRARLRLIADMLLDLLILAVLVLVSSVGAVVLIVAVRAATGSLDIADLGSLGRSEQLQLIGVGGVMLVLALQNGLFVAVPALRTRLLRREPLATIGMRAERPLRLIAIGAGLGTLLLLGNIVLGLIFERLGIRQNQADQYPLFAGDYLGQALFLIGVAVLAPIGEEVLFRGYVFHTLLRAGAGRRWGAPVAYAVSALLFGLAHSLAATEGVVALIVPTTIMGLALAWGVRRTGSILPGIVAHGINNGVALTVLVTCINSPGMCPGI